MAVVSLTGPANALVERAVRAARARGLLILAPVGNGGPASPPAYPAAHAEVLAVTGVDRGGRLLPEAGRPRRVDFAAPGSGIAALQADGRVREVRGTSFAVPLAAARAAAHHPEQRPSEIETAIARLVAEAGSVRPRPGDRGLGHGILCAKCVSSHR